MDKPVKFWASAISQMSFLYIYNDKYQLDKLPDDIKNRLDSIEQEIDNTLRQKGPLTFEDVITTHGPKLANLVDRVALHFNDWNGSLINVSTFKFVINIGFEVYQIVHDLSSSIITDDMSAVEKEKIQISLGTDLIYFVWMIVDPFRDKLKWLPFRRVLEKKTVKWLASMAIKAAMDFFETNVGIKLVDEEDKYFRSLA